LYRFSIALGFVLLIFGVAFTADSETGFVQNPDGTVTAPDGLVWYPVITQKDGTISMMTYDQALTCCNNGPRKPGYPASCPFGDEGQSLPSLDEFGALRDQLGYRVDRCTYDPSPVPGLKDNWFWSCSPYDTDGAWAFVGNSGYDYITLRYNTNAVRCVGRFRGETIVTRRSVFWGELQM
jgi:hypothetical protein